MDAMNGQKKNWIKGKIRVMFKANCDLPQGSLSTKSHPQNWQKSNETCFFFFFKSLSGFDTVCFVMLWNLMWCRVMLVLSYLHSPRSEDKSLAGAAGYCLSCLLGGIITCPAFLFLFQLVQMWCCNALQLNGSQISCCWQLLVLLSLVEHHQRV